MTKTNVFLRFFLPLAVVVSGICGTTYLTVQQDYRMSANDPQIQIAEDGAAMLNQGQQLNMVVPVTKVPMDMSLAPFVMVFNDQGKLLASSVTLHGQAPQVPAGVFSMVKAQGEKRFTWQPEVGVRSAVVVAPFNHGFVLVGRSLREVEKREDNLTIQMAGGWIATLVIGGITLALLC